MGIIDKTSKKNLKTKNPKIPSFCLLPKIHKPSNPGRVNIIVSVTEKIPAFVDLHLRKCTPSYVRDITHFINIIKNIQLEPQDILVTIDVNSLYMNIPCRGHCSHKQDDGRDWN